MPLLSQAEYQATFSDPMRDVTEAAEELVDLWAYATEIIDSDYPVPKDWDWRVTHIYESGDGKYQHLNIPVPIDNTYLIVIVDKPLRKILGHYNLTLYR
jgi:hypothetical protein